VRNEHRNFGQILLFALFASIELPTFRTFVCFSKASKAEAEKSWNQRRAYTPLAKKRTLFEITGQWVFACSFSESKSKRSKAERIHTEPRSDFFVLILNDFDRYRNFIGRQVQILCQVASKWIEKELRLRTTALKSRARHLIHRTNSKQVLRTKTLAFIKRVQK